MTHLRFPKLLSLISALTLLATQAAAPGVGAESADKAPNAHTDTRPETRLVINIPSRTLWVYSGDQIIRYFPVGVGRVGYMTPLGKFSIIRKVIDPGWENPYLPNGRVRLAPGEDNPLGTRWMGFYQNAGGEYGMHGTDNPTSVGKFSSHGCVRLKVPDAEALFELVSVGTPVEVTYQPVLIRRHGNNVRVIVYADRFKRGMPSEDAIRADIIKQYPTVRLDEQKLHSALQIPLERPVEVGVIAPEIQPQPEAVQTNPAPNAAVQSQTRIEILHEMQLAEPKVDPSSLTPASLAPGNNPANPN